MAGHCYDYALNDGMPSLGMQTINALTATGTAGACRRRKMMLCCAIHRRSTNSGGEKPSHSGQQSGKMKEKLESYPRKEVSHGNQVFQRFAEISE